MKYIKPIKPIIATYVGQNKIRCTQTYSNFEYVWFCTFDEFSTLKTLNKGEENHEK